MAVNDMLIIDDTTPNDITHDPQFSRGYVERDLLADPPEMFAQPSTMDLIPKSEWDARIDEQEALQSSLAHMRLTANNGQEIMCLDQDGFGYCWSHSVTHTIIMDRMKQGLPYVPLSAFAPAAIIKGGKDEGGWCGLSAKFAREVGIPSQEFWPQGSANLKYDTATMRANAGLHKITEDYVDLAKPVYDQNLTFNQVATCLLLNIPVAVDFNWWSHSVCAIRLVRVEAGSYGLLILNSWYLSKGVEWGDHGTAILRGSKALPDGAVATRGTRASDV